MLKRTFFYTFILVIASSCSKESSEVYVPVLKPIEIPRLFENLLIAPIVPSNNPQTEEGILLGKKLFFDPILSANNTQSCSSCHDPQFAFADNKKFSEGIDGKLGNRNSMPLFNMAWNFDEKFFWNGRSNSIEEQALEPVRNPVEMHNTWVKAMASLQDNLQYPDLFFAAFGTRKIDSTLVAKALAQFERTLISSSAKFDKYLAGTAQLTASELSGFNVFMNEAKGDCFHCHGSDKNPLWTDNKFHNNGLDNFPSKGLESVTGNSSDRGKFKTPSIRNLAFTTPYMHDGRFATIDAVINHYSEGLKTSRTIDPLIKKVEQGGVQLSPKEKADLKAFLLTLSDNDFIKNAAFQN
ncbi:MAG: cytochrome c peroxidase [Polaribacter sp.]|nr:cytochrome c peroxidase [Polaribacter sp.]